MSSVDPKTYEPTSDKQDKVSYDEDFNGKLFYWKDRLVMVLRRQGGSNQVAVADVVSGEMVGYPSVNSLKRAKKTGPPQEFAKSPYKPASTSAPEPSSTSTSSSRSESNQKDWDKLQKKLQRASKLMAAQPPSGANQTDLKQVEKSIDELMKSLDRLYLHDASDESSDSETNPKKFCIPIK